MTEAEETIGMRLRRLRLERGLTQQGLAEPKLSAAYISQLEGGIREPSQVTVDFLAAQLEVTADELLTGRPANLKLRLELAVQEAKRLLYGGQQGDAAHLLSEALLESRAHGLEEVSAAVEETLGLMRERMGEAAAALEHYEAARLLHSPSPPSRQTGALCGMARCHQSLGDARYGVYLLESHLRELETTHPDPVAEMRVLGALVGAFFAAGMAEKAVDAADRARALEPRSGQAEHVACMHINVARASLYKGKAADALRSLNRAEDIFSQLEWREEVARAAVAQGIVFAEKGAFDEAKSSLGAALHSLDAKANPLNRARALNELGRVERLSGDSGRAQDLVLEALSLLGDQDMNEMAMAHRELGLSRADDLRQAESSLRRALEFYRSTGDRLEVASTLKSLGDLYRAFGKHELMAECYREGIEAVEERSF